MQAIGDLRRKGAALLVLLVGTLLMLIATLVPLSIAPAEASHNTCNVGELCLWGDPNFQPDFWGPPGNSTNWPCGIFCDPDLDNNEDSLRSRESKSAYVYHGTGYTGGVIYCVIPGLQVGNIWHSRDNMGDSHSISATATTCLGYPKP